ncbi:helix-turn-helix transcriptional regulator [Kribbella monticola]|uniref:helix-turn-helix transcriptional regulator n=1 Tax=Kribbella monticola TaxID=2185285 RepID=UPI000DD4569B|nr:helix-turn-helix domain-containing protein [Kribbella monticola]
MATSIQRRWTVEDVAEYLGVPVKTLYKWRCQAYGPRAVRVGKHLRYDPDDVIAWFDAQKSAS